MMPANALSRQPTRLQRLVYTLRTEGGSRAQEAWAIGLGLPSAARRSSACTCGCASPSGWLFGLNRLKLYLAANLVNPLIMPAVLFAEVQIGSWLRRGEAIRCRWRRSPRWTCGTSALDLFLGSVILGVVGGAVAGLPPRPRSAARYRDPEFTRLVRETADRYLGTA